MPEPIDSHPLLASPEAKRASENARVIAIDRISDIYEAACLTGHPPEIEDIVPQFPADWQSELRVELEALRDAYQQRGAPSTPSAAGTSDTLTAFDFNLATLSLPGCDDQGLWLGRYRTERRLGVGAASVVWKARDTLLNRVVALKLPHPSRVESTPLAERFLREAQSAAALDHPNVVRIYEIRVESELPVLIQEFVDGESLAELLKRRHADTQLSFAGLISYRSLPLDCPSC